MDFVALCRGFMKERTESQFKDLEAPIKVSNNNLVRNDNLNNKILTLIYDILTRSNKVCNKKIKQQLHHCLSVCLQERMLLSLADLITMATFLGVTPSIKDAYNTAARGEKRGAIISNQVIL